MRDSNLSNNSAIRICSANGGKAYYYSALGNLYGYKPSKDDCEKALYFYDKYREAGGNIEIKLQDICKD